eukprot:Lithocolla_globosa_v1_NODE_3946_length_1545_cov_8.134228.p3 type:complete len:103 gc:universal NODE_3946_length_1545_cov_8.134228:374-682(+)
MSIVFPDGYVLDTIGPFQSDGRNSDSHIIQFMMENQQINELMLWLKSKNAVFVLDRGFRDCVLDLEMLTLTFTCHLSSPRMKKSTLRPMRITLALSRRCAGL